jgi:signal transduction histidine kinase/CheY-like chemotaxis protein/methyl-accepting chemotaxis protein
MRRWFAWRSAGIRRRLLLILGLTSLAIGLASLVALLALLDIRREVDQVVERELPASAAALVLARIGERLQDRTPALLAAQEEEARRRQTELIQRDLLSLAGETERLSHLLADDPTGVEEIAGLSLTLAENLRELAGLLEARAVFDNGLQQQRRYLIDLRERVAQTLGPSILAVADVLDRPQPKNDELFHRAARAQSPLLEVERLVGAAFGGLLLADEASDDKELERLLRTFQRTGHQLENLVPHLPAGLRPELAEAIAELAQQSKAQGIFALRGSELEVIAEADRLVLTSRRIAGDLKARVDRLVQSANENIARAAGSMGETILANTLLFLGVSITLVLLATLLSYRYVVRDISENLRAVTGAMQRLADGERDARVPAMERQDEIGDLARVFNVFKDDAFRMERLDRQLTEKSNLLLATFDNMNDGFTVCDADDRLVAWNPRYLQLYRLSDREIDYATPLSQIHRLLAERGVRAFDSLGQTIGLEDLGLERNRQLRQFELRCPDGQRVELRSNPMPDGGYVTIHSDVTERRAIEHQLRQAQKMEAVGQLTGGLAHDFNNILAVILGNLTQLEYGVRDDPALHERWQRAMSAADRAARQVERLLAFSRRQKLEPETTDINALVLGMIELLAYSLGEGITLETDLDPELPAVRVDPGQLENALMNLALNASDAMQGQGHIGFSTARHSPDTMEITVSDTGYGIAPGLLERVFEPFFTTKAPGKGGGLGLSMVYGFVRQSGGEIHIDSTPGQGTCIHIRLPVATAAEIPSTTPKPATEHGTYLPRGNGEWVLAVDDDPELLQTTADQLRELGYRVLTANNGNQALARLAAEPAIRVLYTDVVMPEPWDGISLAQEALSRRPMLGILYTSGEHQVITDPPAELLAKPVLKERLADALRELIEK